MATLDDVAAIALGLPATAEGEDLGEKEAVLAAHPRALFTIPHFDGYAAVLVRLRTVSARVLREPLVDGWLACAPGELARTYVAEG